MKRKLVNAATGEVTEVELTAEEIAEHEAALSAHEAKEPHREALTAIQSLESEITPRRIREAVLTAEGKAWLDAQEKAIELQRNKLNGE